MIKLFYAMQEELLKKYAQDKNEILTARNSMESAAIETAKVEIMKECQVFDFDPAEPESLIDVKNGIAEIFISGMLVNKVDFCSAFFGETVTTYRYIREAVAQAEADPDVKKIMFNVNSGGGVVSGCELAFQSIVNADKPTIAVVHDMAASAAFWLASGCDEIVSVSKTGFFGSIGVAVEIVNHDKEDETIGIKRTVLTNTSSKDKRPDMLTEDGQQVMIDELDAVFDVFVDSILMKRSGKMSRSSIEDLGGKVVIASKAIELGLVDRVMNASEVDNFLSSDTITINNESSPVTGGNISKKDTKDMEMTKPSEELGKFLESNPEAKAVFDKRIDTAVTERVEAAINADRERGSKILKLAGVNLPKEVLTAYSEGMDSGEFAEGEISRRNETKAELNKENTDLGKLQNGSQSKDAEGMEGETKTETEKKMDAAIDKIVGKPKGDK